MVADGEGRRGLRGEVGGEKRRSVDESETGERCGVAVRGQEGKGTVALLLNERFNLPVNLSTKTTARSRCAHRRFA